MAQPAANQAPQGFSADLGGRLRTQMAQISQRMEAAILSEVPHYAGDPARYRQPVFQRCRLATRMFLRILTTGQPPGPREITVVQNIARNIAIIGEPLEPMLHALQLDLTVGWDGTTLVHL